MGSKSLNRCKKVGVKFHDLLILVEWLEGNFAHFSITLLFDFAEILNFVDSFEDMTSSNFRIVNQKSESGLLERIL